MDISRYPFSQLARLHDSESAPLIEQRWFFTDLPYIGGLSLFNNRHLDSDQWKERPLGSAADWIDRQRYNGNWTQPPGLTGKHMCHPEWFATGQPWPVTTPPMEYDANGIPTCCRAGADAAQGGVEIGGQVGDVYTATDATAGGVSIGGAAGDVFFPSDPTAGGVMIGGAAGDVFYPPDPTEGGLELGGAAGDTFSTDAGVWEREIPGTYTFTAEFTGDHLIRLWGPGGGGGETGSITPDTGGGGGACAERVEFLTLGTDYTVFVGAGGLPGFGAVPPTDNTFFEADDFYRAEGGEPGAIGGDGGGAFGADSFEPGGDGSSGRGAGGGAGPDDPGNNASGSTGGAAVPGGGAGGDAGGTGDNPGGGGGGGDTGEGGVGGRGKARITWPAPP